MQHIVWLKIFKLNQGKCAKFNFSFNASIARPISRNSARGLHRLHNQDVRPFVLGRVFVRLAIVPASSKVDMRKLKILYYFQTSYGIILKNNNTY